MKNCKHGEKFCLDGKIDWEGKNYNVMVCIGCGQVFFTQPEDMSGDFYQVVLFEDNGYNVFKLEKVFTPKYQNDKLWIEIEKNAAKNADGFQFYSIELPLLRQILEEFKILGDEKDGM